MKTLKKYKLTKGFTVIELVIVISLIGILSAVALPRIIDLSSQAKSSAQAAVKANLDTSLELIKAQWVSEGKSNVVKNVDGAMFFIGINNSNGAVKNIASSLTDTQPAATLNIDICISLWNNLLKNPPKASSAATDSGCLYNGSCTVRVGAFDPNYDECIYQYSNGNFIGYNRVTGLTRIGNNANVPSLFPAQSSGEEQPLTEVPISEEVPAYEEPIEEPIIIVE